MKSSLVRLPPTAAGDADVGPVRLSFQGATRQVDCATSGELGAVWSECGEQSCSGKWIKLGRRTGMLNYCQDFYVRASDNYDSWDFRKQVLSAVLETKSTSCGWICRDGVPMNWPSPNSNSVPSCNTYKLILGRMPAWPEWINLEQKVTNC
jgi:hypothetical protein